MVSCGNWPGCTNSVVTTSKTTGFPVVPNQLAGQLNRSWATGEQLLHRQQPSAHHFSLHPCPSQPLPLAACIPAPLESQLSPVEQFMEHAHAPTPTSLARSSPPLRHPVQPPPARERRAQGGMPRALRDWGIEPASLLAKRSPLHPVSVVPTGLTLIPRSAGTGHS
jgi:hypothetical protein